MPSKEKQETVISSTAADSVWRISAAHAPHIHALRKRPLAKEIRNGTFPSGGEWAEFEIPRDQWSPVTGFKRTVNMTDEQKAAHSARLAAVRTARAGQAVQEVAA